MNWPAALVLITLIICITVLGVAYFESVNKSDDDD